MKQAKFKVLFDRRNIAKLPDDVGTISIDCIKNGKRLYLNTGIRIKKKYWKGKNPNWVSSQEENYLNHNAIINNQYLRLLKFDQSQFLNGEEYDLTALKSIFNAKVVSGFMEFFEQEFIDNPKLADNTKKNYRSTYNHLKASGLFKSFIDLTYSNIESFDRYLKRKNCSDATRHKYHKNLKHIISESEKRKLIPKHSNPYEDFKILVPKTESTYLTEPELDRIINLDISNSKYQEFFGLLLSRDIFLFCAYTSLRYGDVIQISDKNIHFNEEGIFYSFISQKTKKKITMNLRVLFKLEQNKLSRPEQIIMKYRNVLNTKPFKISLQNYNRHLKELAKMAKIQKVLTSHVARHTFGYYMANRISQNEIAELMGHTDQNTTSKYIHMKREDVEKRLVNTDWQIKSEK